MNYKYLLISLMVLVIASSCQKYEDGPSFSLRSKKARVTNTWKLNELFIDGSKQELTEEDKRSRVTLKKDGYATILLVSDTSLYEFTGTWDFENKKEVIEVDGSINYNGAQYNETMEFKILRLKEKELWLEYEMFDPSTFQNQLIEAHYIPE